MRKFLKRACLWGGGALGIALALALVLQWALSHRALRDSPVPGRLIDVDGHLIHLLCEGSGSPTVILEAGLPGSSLTWASVVPQIAKLARACTYDRAGYAWSESAAGPRTTSQIVRELRLLLQNAQVEAPYVLVGHSFGGLVSQLYAGRFPDEVAGMVLVDSSHADLRLRMADLEQMGTLSLGVRILAPLGVPRRLLPVPAGSPQSRASSVVAMEKKLLMTTGSLRAMASELGGLRESLNEVAADSPDLGSKPLVVLTEGRRRAGFWHELQEKLTNLSTASQWVVAENAGHFIHHDQPELVVDAVRRVVELARSEAM